MAETDKNSSSIKDLGIDQFKQAIYEKVASAILHKLGVNDPRIRNYITKRSDVTLGVVQNLNNDKGLGSILESEGIDFAREKLFKVLSENKLIQETIESNKGVKKLFSLKDEGLKYIDDLADKFLEQAKLKGKLDSLTNKVANHLDTTLKNVDAAIEKVGKATKKINPFRKANSNPGLDLVEEVVEDVAKSESSIAKASRFSRLTTGAKSVLGIGTKILPAVAVAHEISSGVTLNNEELAREQSVGRATAQSVINGAVIGAGVTGTVITSGLAIGGASTLLAAGAVNIWNPVGWGLLAVGGAAAIYTAYTGKSVGKGISDAIFGDDNTSQTPKPIFTTTSLINKPEKKAEVQEITSFIPETAPEKVKSAKYIQNNSVTKIQEEINTEYRKSHGIKDKEFKIIAEDGKLGPRSVKAALELGMADKIGFSKLKNDKNFIDAVKNVDDNYFKQLNQHKDFETKVIAKLDKHNEINKTVKQIPSLADMKVTMKAESTDASHSFKPNLKIDQKLLAKHQAEHGADLAKLLGRKG